VTYAGGLMERILQLGRPAYVRIPKGAHSNPDSKEDIVLLRGSGDDVLLVSYGNPAQTCIDAYKIDPRISVLVINRLRPLEEGRLIEILDNFRRIIVVEDHIALSGLYGSLCELIARHPLKGHIESLAPSGYTFEVGTKSDYFFEKYGLDVSGILSFIGS
jgi:transketolase C-terminal domain/subunit